MAKLKAGSVTNLQIDTLAGRMDQEFVSLWNGLKADGFKDVDLPNDPAALRDRRLLFVAIARGMLRYLEDHKADIETTEVTLGGGFDTTHDHQLEFDWE